VTFPDHYVFKDNLIGKSPQLVDAGWSDFRLRSDSPALGLGFKPLPAQQIGLVKDQYRTAIERVESRLDLVKPITVGSGGAAAGRVRLTLRNRGDVPVEATEYCMVRTMVPHEIQGYIMAEKQVAAIAGNSQWQFRIEPGQQVSREFNIAMLPGAAKNFSLLEIKTRGGRARPAWLRTQVVYPLVARLTRRPSTSMETGAEMLRLTVANTGKASISDTIKLTAKPSGLVKLDKLIPVNSAGIRYDFPVYLPFDPPRNQASVEIIAEGKSTQAARIVLPIEHRIPQLPVLDSLSDVKTLLDTQKPFGVYAGGAGPQEPNQKPFAEFRLGITMDDLVISGRVLDPKIIVTEALWTGSCIEVFGSTPGQERIGQVFLVPQSEQGPARGFRQDGNSTLPAPEIKVRSKAVEGGYEIQALIPLKLLSMGTMSGTSRFEIAVTTGTPETAGARRGTIFGSPKAYADNSYYGTLRWK
jgi:hypothetical protein